MILCPNCQFSLSSLSSRTTHHAPHTAHRTLHTAHRTPHTAHRTPHTAHRTPHHTPYANYTPHNHTPHTNATYHTTRTVTFKWKFVKSKLLIQEKEKPQKDVVYITFALLQQSPPHTTTIYDNRQFDKTAQITPTKQKKNTFAEYSAANGHLDLLKWAIEYGYLWNKDRCGICAARGMIHGAKDREVWG
jgi:hypothetical protein